jgi:hypothetical protein
LDPPVAPAGSTALGWGSFIGIVGLVFAGVVVFWQLGRTRAASGERQPDPPVGGGGASSRFCQQCGRPISGEDRFCSGCGTALSEPPQRGS